MKKVGSRKTATAIPRKVKAVVFEFNPNSFDAQFSKLHSTLKEQDKSRNARMDAQDGELKEIKDSTAKTNGRVTILEGKWKVVAGWVAGAAAATTLAVNLLLHYWK